MDYAKLFAAIVVLPEWIASIGFDQKTPFHRLTLDGHTAEVVAGCEAVSDDPRLKAAAMLHDLGKLKVQAPKLDKATGQPDGSGQMTYFKHNVASVEIASPVLAELPEADRNLILALIRLHDWCLGAQDVEGLQDKAIRKMFREIGGKANFGLLDALRCADIKGQAEPEPKLAVQAKLRAKVEACSEA